MSGASGTLWVGMKLRSRLRRSRFYRSSLRPGTYPSRPRRTGLYPSSRYRPGAPSSVAAAPGSAGPWLRDALSALQQGRMAMHEREVELRAELGPQRGAGSTTGPARGAGSTAGSTRQ
ncbi:MAG: hypothetical protein ACYDH5_07565 [Acidimicrobiales bacterium]